MFMVRTILRRIRFALKELYCAWNSGLLRVQPEKIEDGRENSIAIGRFREAIYAQTVIGSG